MANNDTPLAVSPEAAARALGNEARELRASLASTFLISAAIAEEMREIRQALPVLPTKPKENP
ncbi:hypothetical protein NFC81_08560 [Salinispirillum sp. LH 10-3-1]|uniref:DUF1778 domain-containing protein n=1 Tax=Salinispirillum sp. LH 10-3-1 TaxID=2952525 RepID=A0AB38YBT1_9GAMM